MLRQGTITETLIFPTELKRSLVKRLHPLRTKRLGPQSNVQKATQLLVCKHCSQNHRTKGSRKLKMHELRCPKKKQ